MKKKILTSLTDFGDDTNYCNPESQNVKQHYGTEEIITCNSKWSGWGITMLEFNIDLKNLKFQIYRSGTIMLKEFMEMMMELGYGPDSSYILIGKCSEI